MEKVLIITYYWPPAGGPGVQRWLKFVKYLRDYDLEPVLFVPENPHYPLKDESLVSEIPEGLEIIKQPIFEPYSLAGIFSKKETQQISSGIISAEEKQNLLQKALLFIRGNFFIPDARMFWVKPSVKFLLKYLEESRIKTVVTTGPPHSVHLIGLNLKKHLEIKWVADFRDPWTSIGYHEKLKLTAYSRKRHKTLEKKVLQKADQLITTSFTTKKEFSEITTTPIKVITNGYDTEHVEKQDLKEAFTLSHIGSLLSGRNPRNLWKGLAELIEEDSNFAKDFRLELTGAVGEEVLANIREAGLNTHLELKGYVSHREALETMRRSSILLLIEINSEETKGIIPGKLFEYMVSERPILAIGPEGGDLEKIITETNTGKFFGYSDKESIKIYLSDSYRAFKEKELKSYPIGLQKYSRKALTGELAKLLK